MEYSIGAIVASCKGTYSGSATNSIITSISFDTRKLIRGKGVLFLDLASDVSDSLSNLHKAQQLGVSFAMSSYQGDEFDTLELIHVENVLEAVQLWAKNHRQQMDIPIVGITGSNGKTIIKEWLSTLCTHNWIVKNPGSYNSQIGVPLSVLEILPKHEIGIFEAGISKPNEMYRLEDIIRPTIGIITNIGDAHEHGFKDRGQKIDEKLKLFKNPETPIIYRKEADSLLADKIELLPNKKYSWSTSMEADYLVWFNMDKRVATITVEKEIYTWTFKSLFKDQASLENLTHCIIAALVLKISKTSIRKRLLELHPISMRMEMKAGQHNCLILDDTYNADMKSLQAALELAVLQCEDRPIHLVISPFLELHQEHIYSLQEMIDAFPIYQISYIGSDSILKHENIQHYPSVHALLTSYEKQPWEHQMIVLKGARQYRLESFLKVLGKRVHRSQLEIHLDDIRSNVNTFRKLIQPKTLLMAVVKASAYGSDSITLSKWLVKQGVDYLAVAYIDEGVELRKAGIVTPIMVMNPDLVSVEALKKYDLEPEFYSVQQLYTWCRYMHAGQIPIHLKLDTGMHRLGIKEDELKDALNLLKAHKLKIKSIFTHFHSSEVGEMDSKSHAQVHRFNKMVAQIEQVVGRIPIKHCCNTAAISRFPQFHMDMVRLGIGLYGITNDESFSKALKPVHTWKSYIAQIKRIKKGDYVGYNQTFKASKNMVIGVVSIGYADGLPRALSNTGFMVQIENGLVPIIGVISMDNCIVDLTSIYQQVQVGSEVLLTYDGQQMQDISAKANMIPYELLCLIGLRIKRIFIKE